jgi:hypothetical protein
MARKKAAGPGPGLDDSELNACMRASRKRGLKTPAELAEKALALYARTLSYAEVGRRLDIPRRTVCDLVHHAAGDDLAHLRLEYRKDLAQEAHEAIGELLPIVRPANLGSEHSSRGSEAARAALDLAKVASLLDPREKENGGVPPVINVYTGVSPPPELASTVAPSPLGPETTTTVTPSTDDTNK